MICVGIDVAKDKHECVIITQDNEILIPSFSFENSKAGFQQLYNAIEFACDGDFKKIKIGLEASGHYSTNLLLYLREQNWNTVYLNPLSVHNLKKAQTLRRTKTDKSDARYIAELMLTKTGKPYQEQEYHILELKSITRARYRLGKVMQREKERYCRSIHLMFPEYTKVFSCIHQGCALEIIAQYPSAKDIANANIVKLTNCVKEYSHYALGKQKALLLKETAKNSIAHYSEGEAFELKLLAERIKFIKKQCNDLEARIKTLMTELNTTITTIPGVGYYLGGVILAEIGDINRFNTPEQIQAYAGTDPAIYQSGKYTATNTPMVKHGSYYLRNAIYLATSMAGFCSPSFKEYINKKRLQGKHYYVAIAHAMKKMVRVIFYILKTGNVYKEPKI